MTTPTTYIPFPTLEKGKSPVHPKALSLRLNHGMRFQQTKMRSLFGKNSTNDKTQTPIQMTATQQVSAMMNKFRMTKLPKLPTTTVTPKES